MPLRLAFRTCLLALISACARPEHSDAGQRTPQPAVPTAAPPAPIAQLPLPGSAFQALPTRDGSFIFVSLAVGDAGGRGIGIVRRGADGSLAFVRLVSLDEAPAGMVLTHDEKLLVVAAGHRLSFLDVARLRDGKGDALLGELIEPKDAGRVHVDVTPDDRYLFASDERARTITVVDLANARASGIFPGVIVGKIPVGNAPVGLAFSPDGRTLYTTSQSMPKSAGWPIVCRREGSSSDAAPDHSEGAIIIVDVERAKADPSRAVIGTVAAGCNPVRLVLAPTGDVAYVSARGTDALLAFDTRKLLSAPAHALVGQVPVGPSPVGVAVIDGGRRVLVTSSNRFSTSPTDKQRLYVIDATHVDRGAAAIVGTIAAGAFPREMRTSADGRTLYLTNYASKTLQTIDLTNLPVTPP